MNKKRTQTGKQMCLYYANFPGQHIAIKIDNSLHGGRLGWKVKYVYVWLIWDNSLMVAPVMSQTRASAHLFKGFVMPQNDNLTYGEKWDTHFLWDTQMKEK